MAKKEKPSKVASTRLGVVAGLVTLAFVISHVWEHHGGSDLAAGLFGFSSKATTPLHCAEYNPSPVENFLQQAEAGFEKHVNERRTKMGSSLPTAEEIELGGSILQLPSRVKLEAELLVPTYSCAVKERLGAWGQGGPGKWVCMTYRVTSAKEEPPVVVSVRGGVHGTSFEEDVFKVLKAKPVIFDPLLADEQLKEMKSSPLWIYQVGVGVVGESELDESKRHFTGVTWATLSQMLQPLTMNTTKLVDVLSLDCRGCENAAIDELKKRFPRERQPFGQILIRLTNLESVKQTVRLQLQLESLGYRLFHAERHAESAHTYDTSFIHESLVLPASPAVPLNLVTGSPFSCSDHEGLSRLLSAAECAYLRNLARRENKVGPLRLPSVEEVELHPFSFQGMQRSSFEASILIPTYPCIQERRLGPWAEGGKWACLGYCKPAMWHSPLVVSVGSNGDGSFEAGIFYNLNSVPHTFDPFIPHQEKAMSYARQLRFHPLGITGKSQLDEVKARHPAIHWLTVQGLLQYLGVTYVDVFKIDCEGCEFSVVEELRSSFTRESPPFGQILMEIHDTRNVTKLMRLMVSLEDLGYRLFHTEVNVLTPLCWEIALIHEKLVLPR